MTFLSLTGAEKRALLVLSLLVVMGGGVQLARKWQGSARPGYRLLAKHPDEPAPPPPTAAADKLLTGINPNTALQEDLELLPGIGPEMASRIVRHRTANGPFKSPSDLLEVKGVGERTLARITPYLRFP